ncbi:acyl-CoA dehydrogenase [Solihabitans fulvus]|uniref:Acyl-CoA dehydrogenase n=1 Tax=Solihabitans fulvus TaxID=1892852 RepID=A0A5B2WST3_9PSEU|nr:acyl-CoA dehydrogenase family protein [Solihabitans fulvus]KAA2254635.1 acyl-CoA dehydrogenase [Solihabitans fulvus]
MTAPTADLLAKVLPVLRDNAAAADEQAAFPSDSFQALRDNHLLSLVVPREYGGGGASLQTFLEVTGELAGACLSTGQLWAMHGSHVDTIVRHGSPELRADLLPRIAENELYIASATSEKGRSSSLFVAHSPLAADGDRVVVDRAAPVVSGGAHADGYLITMRASAEASEHDVCLVYADRHDLRTELAGEWNTLGMRATESIGMRLTGVVPASNVIGAGGQFAALARESMIPISHLSWSAAWLGAARGAFRELVRWFAKSGAPDMSDLFHERLARVRLDLELVSAYLTRVREEVDLARIEGGSVAHSRAQLQINALKVVASDLSFRAVDHMVQLAGLRIGYAKNSPIALERCFRDLRSASLNHANDGLRVGIGALCLLDRSVSLI